MALPTHVGSTATGTTSVTKSVTAGNLLCVHAKWETASLSCTGASDGAGNTWVLAKSENNPANQPGCATLYCLAAKTTGSITVTPTITGSPTSQRCELDEFNSTVGTWALDVATVSGNGTGGGGAGGYSTSATLATTGSGVCYFCVSDFNGLLGAAAGGTPTHTLGTTDSDCLTGYLLSGSAQTVTPGASVTSGYTQWVMQETAFKEVAGGIGARTSRFVGQPMIRGPF